MVAFRLCYDRWARNPDRNQAEGPIFQVYTGETELSLVIHVLVDSFNFRNLQQEIALQEETRFPNDPLRTAVVRFAVARIAQGLQDGLFLALPTHTTLPLPVEEADLPAIRQLLQEKTCAYQTRQGRDLLCSVASVNDPTRRGQTGLQTFAPTSRVLCRTCALPDTDYLCSHLMHPEVLGRADRGILQSRELLNALCDLGKAEIQNAAKCHADGHACWERLVEQELDRPVIPVSPLTLPEAFDYLDVCWRLAFGKKQSLVRLNNLTGVTMLSLSCATRDELIARLSALGIGQK